MRSLRALDIYPKISEDFRERTLAGAAISVVCVVVVGWLVASEVAWYGVEELHDIFLVDTAGGMNDRMNISLNITFPSIQCDMLQLDVLDGFGEAQTGASGSVTKTHLAANGSAHAEGPANINAGDATAKAVAKAKEVGYCGSCYGAGLTDAQCCNTCADVRDAYRRRGWSFSTAATWEQCVRERLERAAAAGGGEGCTIAGWVSVPRVNGNFHFAPGHSFDRASAHIHDFVAADIDAFNTSHVINHLSFGAATESHRAGPLEGHRAILDEDTSGLFQYFLKIVPTTVYGEGGVARSDGNVYSVTRHFRARTSKSTSTDAPGGEMAHDAGREVIPAVVFVYDLSPIRVVTNRRRPHASVTALVLALAAVVGGVFTAASICDALCYHGSRRLQKLRSGKAA